METVDPKTTKLKLQLFHLIFQICLGIIYSNMLWFVPPPGLRTVLDPDFMSDDDDDDENDDDDVGD